MVKEMYASKDKGSRGGWGFVTGEVCDVLLRGGNAVRGHLAGGELFVCGGRGGEGEAAGGTRIKKILI